MKRTVRFSLNNKKFGSQITIEGVHVGDDNSCELAVTITDGNKVLDITDGSTVATMSGTKPDGTVISRPCSIVDNTIFYTLDKQDTAASGNVLYQITVASDNGISQSVIATAKFTVSVMKNIYVPIYRPLSSQPSDWSSNYKSYFRLVNNRYEVISDSVCPTFKSNTFYYLVNPNYSSEDNYESFHTGLARLENLIGRASDILINLNDKQEVSNIVSDIRNVTNQSEQYPSIEYLNGYFYDFKEIDNLLFEKSDKSDTLKGYGITDSYTKTEVDKALSEKADTNLILKRTKNLIRLTDTDTDVNGLQIMIKDNHIRLQGTTEKAVYSFIKIAEGLTKFEQGKNYVASVQNVVNHIKQGAVGIYLWKKNEKEYETVNASNSDYHKTIDTTQTRDVLIMWNIPAGKYDKEFDFQIEAGTEVTAFEPYYVVSSIENGAISYDKLSEDIQTEFKKIPEKANKSDTYTKADVDKALSEKADTNLILKRTKNLIRLTDTDTDVNGLHITIKNNHFCLKGTASAPITSWISANVRVETYKAGTTYVGSAQNVKGSGDSIGIKFFYGDDKKAHMAISNTDVAKSFMPDSDITGNNAKLSWNIPIGSYNKEFDLMLEIGSEPTAFEPYYVVSSIENGSISYDKLSTDIQTEFKKISGKANISDVSSKISTFKFEDITNAETGCYWNAIPHNPDSNWECIAEPIPCSEGDIFRFTAATVNLDGHQQVVKCYDSNKKLISTHHGPLEDGKPISYVNRVFVIPSGISFVVFNCWLGSGKYSLKVEKAIPVSDVETKIKQGLLDESPTMSLYGKSMYNDGDSIAQGAGSNGVSYAHLLRDKYNMNLVSKAVGGTTLAVREGRTDSIYERMISMTGDYDFILFDGGSNDISFNVPAGVMTDSFTGPFDVTTTLGALEAVCQFLNTHYLTARKLFIILNSRISDYYKAQTDIDNQVKKVLRKWSIPWVDISAVSGFGNWNDTVASEYFLDDKLHPKLEAYKKFYLPYIDSALRYGGYINGNTAISGKDGNNVIGVSKSEINSNGELIMTYSDGTSTNLGVVVGSNGEDGTNGIDGKDYILTNEDKSEIVQQVLSALPSAEEAAF